PTKYRLTHGIRRHAQIAGRKLSPSLAGVDQDDRRSARDRKRTAAKNRSREKLNRCTRKEGLLRQPSNKHYGSESHRSLNGYGLCGCAEGCAANMASRRATNNCAGRSAPRGTLANRRITRAQKKSTQRNS